MGGGTLINNFGSFFIYKRIICILFLFLLVGSVSAASYIGYTSQYPPGQNDTYVKATTSDIASNLYPYYATDPTKSLTGGSSGNSWRSASNQYINQRFHIDLGSSKIIKKIYYDQTFDVWGDPGTGVEAKDFTIWGSNTAGSFSNLTYSNNTGWTQIPISVTSFDARTSIPTPKYVMVDNNIAYRYYALKIATNYNGNPASSMALRRVELQTQDVLISTFTSNVTSGIAPFSVSFNGTSVNTTNWAWLFGDENWSNNSWVVKNLSGGWGARQAHASVTMPDGSIILTGGNTGSLKNDTWRSIDNGTTWTLQNASSGWSARYYHSMVVVNNNIILFGGYDGNNKNDTWKSIDNGITWTLINASSGWSARRYQVSTTMPDDSIILTSGVDSAILNDTWRSTDGGVTWIRQNASSGWQPRYYQAVTAMPDGSIILTGGAYSTNPYYNDTWRSTNNGVTWTLMNASSGWDVRYTHSTIGMSDGSIILFGGGNYTNATSIIYYNDTWRSTNNGATWTRLNANNNWEARILHSSVFLPNGSIVIMGGAISGGTLKNDTWIFTPVTSVLQNVTHIYPLVGAYNVSLQVNNYARTNSTQKVAYIKSSIPSYTSIVGQYTVVKFNNTGSTEWTSPVGVNKVDYLVVAGGGAGGDIMGGGGGAGGFLDGFNYSVTPLINYTITIGDGGKYLDTAGNPPALRGVQGKNSSFDIIESVGGGGGSAHAYGNATNGGSGGGGGSNNAGGTASGGSNVSGQGWAGGNSAGFWYYGGAGGGGASQVGSNSVGGIGSNYGGNGGNGKNSSITGVNVTYAGGGGGGGSKYGNNVNGTGGTGGGGNGGGGPGQSTNATDELGGGGGGVYHDYDYPLNSTIDGTFGRGGSGIVILRYLTPAMPNASFTSNVTIGSPPTAVQFNDTSINSPAGWAWYFGDENMSSSVWSSVNTTTGWFANRGNAGFVALPDGSFVLAGGGNSYYNDTWRSTDNGNTWTLINASSGWQGRNQMGMVALPDGSIVLVGGYKYDGMPIYFNDAWKSTDKGATWTLINSSVYSSGRYCQAMAVLSNGDIVSVAGFNGGWTTDTWKSTDGGYTWSMINASYGGSDIISAGLAALPNNDLILAGGQSHGSEINATWRSIDGGVTWTLRNASSGWRYGINTRLVPLADGSVILTRYQNNQTWRTTDEGAFWSQINSLPYLTSGYYSMAINANGTILAGGSGTNIYKLETASSTSQSPVHVYTTIGKYNISLQVYNSVGYNLTRKIQYIDIGVRPTASFKATELSGVNGYSPFVVSFSDNSSGIVTGWNWSFGDDSWNNVTQNSTHVYTVNGNYTVALRASNIYGSDTTYGIYWINVSSPPAAPIANFIGTNLSGLPLVVGTFTDTSINNATGWAWFFGNETYTQAWVQQNASAGWSAREFHTMVTLTDGSILLMGGNDGNYKNDTWISKDKGITWYLVNSSSGWAARGAHTSVVLSDGSIVLMGGTNGNYMNDVWRSTDKGATWTQINSSAGWSARYGHTSVALSNDYIILMGGYNSTELTNDVWRSTDSGITWDLVSAHAGWDIRYYHSSTVTDNIIYLMGGVGNYNLARYDTWRSTDGGFTWVKMSESPIGSWGDRGGLTCVAMPDRSIIVTGGNVYGGLFPTVYYNDTWRSIDNGTTWTQTNASVGWTSRQRMGGVVLPDGSIVIAGGSTFTKNNDVWRFNPVSSVVQNPYYSFNTGYHNISLQAYNSGGYSSKFRPSYINVYGYSAAFNVTPNPAQIGTTIEFVDMSGNSPTSWYWTFGDGNSSTSRNVSYNYQNIGTYNVTLNASTLYGSSCSTVIVTVYPTAPVANFSVDHNIGSNPLTVLFTDTSGSGVLSWYWVFGDGSTDTVQNPSHTYTSLGTYYPQLTITSSVGTNVSQPVTIYVVNSAVPIADFVGLPLSGSSPLSVQFSDLSAALNPITGWNWSFGDGSYSNDQNPSHIYYTDGQYTVTLLSTSGVFSNYTTKSGYVNAGIISSTVYPNFIANTTYAATYPAAVAFTDYSVCNPACTNWIWDFNNDGSVDSMDKNPTYVYNYPGNYSPKLIVSNGMNTGTKIRSLYIVIGPILVKPTIPQPSGLWHPGYQVNGSDIFSFKGDANIDLANSTYLKYWLQNFTTTGNFSVYGFATGIMAPIMHVFGFWIFLIIWGSYLFAVWIRSQDVTMPLIIGILSIGTFGLLFPKESLPVIIIMFVICGAVIITKVLKE